MVDMDICTGMGEYAKMINTQIVDVLETCLSDRVYSIWYL